MAFSSSVKNNDIHGTMICKVIVADFAAVTAGHIVTGLKNIAFASVNNEVTANKGKVAINMDVTGAIAESGSLYLSAFTANDKATVLVYGN